MKLEKTMLQYVLDLASFGMECQSINHQNRERSTRFYKILKYANFLNQPLNISMFVPAKLVDDKWVVLEEPQPIKRDSCLWFLENEEYRQAKENVIFEGFEILDGFKNIIKYRDKKLIFLKDFDIIEDLIPFQLTLNPNLKTLRQLFL